MKFWIAHPAADGCPVGFVRWAKWHLSEWFDRKARKLASDALYPNCEGCGQPRNRGDHSRYYRAECDRLRAALKGYEQWEADLLMSEEAWDGKWPSGSRELPQITQVLWDRLLALQSQRNEALRDDEQSA